MTARPLRRDRCLDFDANPKRLRSARTEPLGPTMDLPTFPEDWVKETRHEDERFAEGSESVRVWQAFFQQRGLT